MVKKISLSALVFLILSAFDSIRNLPATALFGSPIIFFFLFSAVVFLIPTTLVAAELSARFPEKGGVYYWVDQAFGGKAAMMALWLQWVNTIVWFPTILSFVAGSIAFLIYPPLITNAAYIILVVLVLFWTLTVLNFFGIHLSAKINTICGVIGAVIPLFFLIVLGAFWLLSGHHAQIDFSMKSLLPSLGKTSTWISLVSIMAAFVGMEMTGVHVNDVKKPEKNFPRALFIACPYLLASLLLGSLSIASVIPREEISLIAGVLQVYSHIFSLYGIGWLLPIITFLIIAGSIGNIINWLIAPVIGFTHASEYGYLPPFFFKKNKHGVSSRLLTTQGILVTLVCLIYFLVPSVNTFYWFLTALSTVLYMFMYLFMFLSALALHYRPSAKHLHFKIPGGTFGKWLITLLGLFGCSLTIVFGFYAPEVIPVASKQYYSFIMGAGLIVMISPVFGFFLYRKHPA